MSNTIKFKVAKLIRDKIPGLLEAKGITLHNRTMDTLEYQKSLKDKLIEEAYEVQQAVSRDELIEELSDTFEVLYALAQSYDISLSEIEEIRLNKVKAKGGFKAKIFNDFVELESDNPDVKYYRAKPKHYPEISASDQ